MPDSDKRLRSGNASNLEESLNELKEQNKALLNKFKKMESSFTQQEKQLREMEKALVENNALIVKINLISADNQFLRKRLCELETEIENVKRDKNRKRLEITGLKSGMISTPNQAVLLLAQQAKCDLQEKQIENAYFRKSRDGNNEILEVKFKEVICRDRFLKEVKKTKPKLESIKIKQSGNVYINEKLTSNAKYIFYVMRREAKERKWAAVWVFSGNVYIKLEKEGNAIPVMNKHDVEEILK